MPCEHYKDALIEAAATGARPQGELQAHLASCASCREAFAQEQSLFAAIDFGLNAAANAEVPPSLLPRVRASLDEAAVTLRLRWLQQLVVACASVALVFLIFLVARPRHAPPEDIAKSPITVPSPTAPAAAANPEKTSRESTQVTDVRVSHSHAARDSTNLHSAASSNPEVLVPPDEREALARFVAKLNERSDLATALLARAPEKRDALIVVERLQIGALEIKPLEGAGAETSNGSDETR
jgi:predicted anti-sigma-YlaC factor YlaD